MFLTGALLAFGSFTGCKQGNGDRCERASDCSSNFCIPCNADVQNMFCADTLNPVCPSNLSSGLGGASASTGGASGEGGADGGGGAGGATDDASTDVAANSSTDGPDDAASTD